MGGIRGRTSSPAEVGVLLAKAPLWPATLALQGVSQPGDLPNSPSGLYWNLKASSVAEPFDRRRVLPYGRKAVEAEPWNVDFLWEHAANCHREGLEGEARELLARAHTLEPRKPEVYNLMTLLKSVEKRHVTFDTPHCRVSLREDEAPALKDLLLPAIERECADLGRRYELTPSRIHIYLYADKQDFDVSVFAVPSAPALGACMGRLVTMPSPLYLESKLEPWSSILRHEMAHAFHCERSEGRVTRWFTEGLAHYEEVVEDPSWDWEEGFEQRLMTLRASGKLAPFGSLNDGFNGPDVRFYYQYCRWVMQWLDETHGWKTILACLDHYKKGGTDFTLMRQVLKKENAAAEAEFNIWLEEHIVRHIPYPPLTGGELTTPEGLATALSEGRHRAILEATESAAGNTPVMWLYRAMALDDLGEDKDSREAFTRAATTLEGDFTLNFRFGRHLFESGDYAAAEPRLRKALSIYPRHLADSDHPSYWLFELFRETGRMKEAYDLLWDYTRVQQKEHRARFWLMREARERNDKPRMALLAEEIRRVHPYHFEAILWEAEDALALGDRPAVSAACRRLFACAPLKGLVDQDTPWTDAERLVFLEKGAGIWLKAAVGEEVRLAAETIKTYLPKHEGALKILGSP